MSAAGGSAPFAVARIAFAVARSTSPSDRWDSVSGATA